MLPKWASTTPSGSDILKNKKLGPPTSYDWYATHTASITFTTEYSAPFPEYSTASSSTLPHYDTHASYAWRIGCVTQTTNNSHNTALPSCLRHSTRTHLHISLHFPANTTDIVRQGAQTPMGPNSKVRGSRGPKLKNGQPTVTHFLGPTAPLFEFLVRGHCPFAGFIRLLTTFDIVIC